MSAREPAGPAREDSDASRAKATLGPRRGLVLAILGFLVGAWSAVCGIGGGIFAVPILHYLYGMSLRAAIANSLVLVAASTTSATVSEIVRLDSRLHLPIVAVLIATCFLGTQLGFRAAQKLDTRKLKIVFCFVLAAVALQVMFAPAYRGDETLADATTFALSTRDVVLVAVFGLAAGFVAPLLGIGGGLVAVPALFLGLPQLGYLGARASSMAMSMFAGWQSVWLYRKQRHVEIAAALWFAGGALLGGWLGVLLVHVPSVSTIAQKMLAATLLFVAGRFAWDVWCSRRERAQA